MGRIQNIEGRKNKQDSKRAQIFTKYARLISVAAKEGGPDPEYNAALKSAIDKAKSVNMPNDNIDRAIKKGSGGSDGELYETIVYEGYGPGGVAIIIETLTDNKNRTAGNVRYYLDKNNGNLGSTGCVSYLFERKGSIYVKQDAVEGEDVLMDLVLEAGAEDILTEEEGYDIITGTENYFTVKEALEAKNIAILNSEITMIPSTYVEIDENQQTSLQKLFDMLDDDDDIQEYYSNEK